MPDNGYVESFNGRIRDELLKESLFFGLDHATADSREAAFFARLPDPGGLCRGHHRNRADAAPITDRRLRVFAGCSPDGVTETAKALIAPG